MRLLLLLFSVANGLVEVDTILRAIEAKEKEIVNIYGSDKINAGDFGHGEFYSDAARERLVERVLRAVIAKDSFVISVGGMSDVAGHGNLFEESYPVVFESAVKDVFAAAGISFTVRNMAMGGVPSYPNSMCMEDNFGADTDVVVWDFRMVERDEIKGELYVRQAMMLPKAPLICFKRKMSYLSRLHYAHKDAALHVLDEMSTYNSLQKHQSLGVTSDKFCQSQCNCPGQVRWHAGWKMQRFRGMHMAMFYLSILKEAVTKLYPTLSVAEQDPQHSRWTSLVQRRKELHAPISKHCKPAFASVIFRCALTWQPQLGPALIDIVDPQLGVNGWRLQHASKRAADLTKRGHSDCGYKDEKKGLVGDQSSHWIFFNLKNVADEGTVAFCGDFASRDFADYALIVLNQEEIMDKLDVWLESKTLGISSACFATTHNVIKGDNVLGFRITSGSNAMSLTHVLWTPGVQ
mmetsp:Transcript_1628/g.2490  ORF Transcript_1628/g.2490 Transcript_1628/m.2490 type:complete len:463 (+) Transcript_1628:22-1410(+)